MSCSMRVCRHQLFVQMVREQQGNASDSTAERTSEVTHDHLIHKTKPAEMPCYEEDGSVPEPKKRWYQ